MTAVDAVHGAIAVSVPDAEILLLTWEESG